MKGKCLKVAAAFLIVGMLFSTAVVRGEDASYWTKFKSVFVDWDDSAKPGSTKTATVGVRGMNVEKELAVKDGYKWDDVNYMEDFPVNIDEEKAFLNKAKLGPFNE
jgi:hypothetical protein